VTEEQRQRQMDFIIEQQAQFIADIGSLESIVTRLANLTLQSKEENDKRAKDSDERLTALTDSHIRLADSQARTEENIRNLTAVVDRYFSEGRDGQS
jgi:two-component sensor histidine kinase